MKDDLKSKVSAIFPANKIAEADLEELYSFLTGRSELEHPGQDRWGNWDAEFLPSNYDPHTPWLDRKAQITLKSFEKASYPEGRRFALCLTHDVDYISRKIQSITTFAGRLRNIQRAKGNYGSKGKHYLSLVRRGVAGLLSRPDPYWNFDAIIEEEKKYGFKSTFFFFPEDVDRRHIWDCDYSYSDKTHFRGRIITARDLVRELEAIGCEIGLHGSYFSAGDPALLSSQRKQIEEIVDTEVQSTRQHYLHYDINKTPLIQASAGLKIDSTRGFNKNVGFRAGTAFPFRAVNLPTGQPLDLWEVCMNLQDTSLVSNIALGLGEEAAIRLGTEVIENVVESGGCVVMNWHPNYSENSIHFTVYKALLLKLSKLQPWSCTLSELVHFWGSI